MFPCNIVVSPQSAVCSFAESSKVRSAAGSLFPIIITGGPFLTQMSYQKPDAKKVQTLYDIANKMRIHSVNMTAAANSG